MLDYFEADGFEADGARSLRDAQDLTHARSHSCLTTDPYVGPQPEEDRLKVSQTPQSLQASMSLPPTATGPRQVQDRTCDRRGFAVPCGLPPPSEIARRVREAIVRRKQER